MKLIENPVSPIALAGAVSLFAHDCIHILLGRGALQQDEAFVVGFTMSASGKLTPLQHRAFAFCARRLYRGSYQFSSADSLVFDLAVDTAKHMRPAQLDRVAFEPLMDRSLGELRTLFAIDKDQLFAAYERERELRPTSLAGARLPRRMVADLPIGQPRSGQLEFL